MIDWIVEINKVRARIETEYDYSLLAYMVRDWVITKQSGLFDLAYSMSKEYSSKNDMIYLLDELEKYVMANK